MKCKVNCGDLKEALETAYITVDKRSVSDLRFLYLGAMKGKNKNERIILHTSNSQSRTLARVPCEVEEMGQLVIDPARLLVLLEHQAENAIVSFSQESRSNRTAVKVGASRGSLSSADAVLPLLLPDLRLFPFEAQPLFVIPSTLLRSLLSRTAAFIYADDSYDGLKNVRVRSTETGYEALSTNKVVLALARIEYAETKGLIDGPEGKLPAVQIEIPGYAVPSLLRLLAKQKEEMIKVILYQNSIFFCTANIMCGSQLSGAVMPSVDFMFQQSTMDTQATVSKDQLLRALSRSDPFNLSLTRGRMVQIDIQQGGVMLSAQDDRDGFEEKIESSAIAGEKSGRFFASHFSEVLRHAEEENVVINMGVSGPRSVPSALLHTGGRNGASYVVAAVCA